MIRVRSRIQIGMALARFMADRIAQCSVNDAEIMHDDDCPLSSGNGQWCKCSEIWIRVNDGKTHVLVLSDWDGGER